MEVALSLSTTWTSCNTTRGLYLLPDQDPDEPERRQRVPEESTFSRASETMISRFPIWSSLRGAAFPAAAGLTVALMATPMSAAARHSIVALPGSGEVWPLLWDPCAGEPLRFAVRPGAGDVRDIRVEVRRSDGSACLAVVDPVAFAFVRRDFGIALRSDGVAIRGSGDLPRDHEAEVSLRWKGPDLDVRQGDCLLSAVGFGEDGGELWRAATVVAVRATTAPFSEDELGAAARSAVAVLAPHMRVIPSFLMMTGAEGKRQICVDTVGADGRERRHRVVLDERCLPVAVHEVQRADDLFGQLWPPAGKALFLRTNAPADVAGEPVPESEWGAGGVISFPRFNRPPGTSEDVWTALQTAAQNAFLLTVRPKARLEARHELNEGGALAIPTLINALNGLDLSEERDLVCAGNLVLGIQSASHDLIKIPLRTDILAAEENRDFNVKVVRSLVQYWKKYDGAGFVQFEEKLAQWIERRSQEPSDW